MQQNRCKIFNAEDLGRIEKAVAEAETKTSGEIVVVVVPTSGDYGWTRWVWSSFGWCVATLILWELGRRGLEFPLREIFLWQLVGAAIGSLLPLWPSLLRLTVPARLSAKHVHREALANFAAAGVFETHGRTGILIYLSELERRVQILGDRGIHAHTGQGYWEEQVKTIITGIRDGRAADGMCEAIRRMGEKLSAHFPPGAKPANELPNQVRIGDQADRVE